MQSRLGVVLDIWESMRISGDMWRYVIFPSTLNVCHDLSQLFASILCQLLSFFCFSLYVNTVWIRRQKVALLLQSVKLFGFKREESLP